MAQPRNPKPNHPFAQAAAAVEREISASFPNADPPETPAPAPAAPAPVTQHPEPTPTPTPTPEPAPVAAAPSPQPTPPAPAQPDEATRRLQANLDTALGRVSALNEELARREREAETQRQNSTFTETRLNDLTRERDEAIRRARELEAANEVSEAARGFNSELVDSAQFAEIFRGLQPHLSRRDAETARVLQLITDLGARLDARFSEANEAVVKLDQKWIDKSVLKSSPALAEMVRSPSGQEFLAQRIPGTRRTRKEELQEAYRDGDEEFIANMVADWKRLGAPVEVPSADPPRTIVTETPKPPVRPVPITEAMVQAKFQEVLDGKATHADFRQLSAQFAKQVASGVVG